MPFKKVGKNKNVSPSGKMFTDKQVKMYYATGGFSPEKIKKYQLDKKKKKKSKLTKRKKRK